MQLFILLSRDFGQRIRHSLLRLSLLSPKMATRPKGYGFTADCQRKMDAKYDVDLEMDATDWIEQVLGESVFGGENGKDNTHKVLKSGVVLCRLANKLGGKLKISEQAVPFKMMENIGKFLHFCEESLAIPKLDLFQTVDLYEKQNMSQVLHAIVAVGSRSHALGHDVPILGPKRSKPNPRSFSEDQLKEGMTIIGLQMGTNKLASQAGDHFGRPRQVAGHDAYP